MDALLQNPATWVSVAFFIFLFFAVKPIFRAVAAALDKRSERIREELDEAVRLREEAQSLLASYQRKHREAQAEADEMLSHAKEEAAHLLKEAEAHLEQVLNKRIQQAMQKIAHAEEVAAKDIQQQVVNLSMQAATQLIQQNVGGKASHMLDEAIAAIPAKLVA